MKVGLWLPTVNPGGDVGRLLVDTARRAEDLGFSSLWAVDHLLPVEQHALYGDMTWLDPLLSLAAVAPATGLPLGTIYCASLRSPVLAAKQLATLMALAPGRVVLGCTIGWNRREHEAAGHSPGTRGVRTDEWLAALAVLLTKRKASFEGRFWRFEGADIDPSPGCLPAIWQTGGGAFYDAKEGDGPVLPAPVLRRALAADGWIASAMASPEAIARDVGVLLRERSARGLAEQPFALAHSNYLHLVETTNEEAAVTEQRRFLDGRRGRDAEFDTLARDFYLTGTVDQVIEKLARRAEAGVQEVVLQAFPGQAADQLPRWAHHVLPAVADL